VYTLGVINHEQGALKCPIGPFMSMPLLRFKGPTILIRCFCSSAALCSSHSSASPAASTCTESASVIASNLSSLSPLSTRKNVSFHGKCNLFFYLLKLENLKFLSLLLCYVSIYSGIFCSSQFFLSNSSI
jgi:hypothetical protein